MDKYDDDMMEEETKRLTKEELKPLRSFGQGRKSDRISNLPSDTALESNKERQDAEMLGALTKFSKFMPYGQLGSAMIEEIAKRRESKPKVPNFKKGGKVSSASKRADGIAQRGKTKGRMI